MHVTFICSIKGDKTYSFKSEKLFLALLLFNLLPWGRPSLNEYFLIFLFFFSGWQAAVCSYFCYIAFKYSRRMQREIMTPCPVLSWSLGAICLMWWHQCSCRLCSYFPAAWPWRSQWDWCLWYCRSWYLGRKYYILETVKSVALCNIKKNS